MSNFDATQLLENYELEVMHAGQTSPTSGWSWDTGEGLRHYDLVTFTQGRGTYLSPEKSIDAQVGLALCFRPGKRYCGQQQPRRPLAMTYIHFQILDTRGRATVLPEACLPPLVNQLQDPDFFIKLNKKCVACVGAGRLDSAAIWLRAALLDLLSEREKPRYRGYEREQQKRIESLCHAVAQNPAGPWRLEGFATALGCAPDHAVRLFRKYVGRTPMDFVIDTRIQTAKSLLQSSSHSVSRISDILGYADVYAFSKQFKRRVGQAPSRFRSGDASL